jgi:solute:Na+ symporter, SSS family
MVSVPNVLSLIIILVFIFVMLAIGVLMYRKRKAGAEDYFLMSRDIPWWLLSMTTMGTMISTFTFLGGVGLGYSLGTSMFFIALSNCWIGIYMITLGHRMWILGKKYGYVSLGEILRDRFDNSKFLEIFFGCSSCLWQIAYLAMMYVGCSYAISTVTGGLIFYKMALLLIVVTTSIYTVVGGMRAVVITDAIQWVLVVITLVAAIVIIAGVGIPGAGVIQGFRTVATTAPQVLGKVMADRVWIEMFIFISVGFFFGPAIWTRMLAARDERAIAWTAANVTFFHPFFMGFVCFLIGIAAWAIYGPKFPRPDNLLPTIMKGYFPWWLGTVIMAGAVAAAKSVISACMLSLSQLITRDIVEPIYGKLTPRGSDHVSYVALVCLGIVSVVIGWLPPASIIIKSVEFSNTGLAMIAPVTIAALYWRRATTAGAIAGFVGGTILAAVMRFGGYQTPWLTGPIWAFIANAVLIVVVSLLTPRTSEATVEKINGYLDAQIYGNEMKLEAGRQ